MNSQIEQLTKLFEQHISNWEFAKAQEILQEIKILWNLLSIKLQKSLNKNIKWVFLEEDQTLENININDKIRNFLEELKNKYWEYVIDEITIMKLKNSWQICATYLYSLSTNKFIEELNNTDNLQKLQSQLTNDLKFFVENIVKKWWLEDGEWTLAGNQTGNSYDIILRIWDYLIWFNNSLESIETLNKKLWISMEELIKQVTHFYKEFKK